ncbi:hypothetical protein L1286_19375 [Pseudoalteromonas sp. SMS1]|uniref:hypothetical protein n=1 Tax=Pseudoalteromonas sp. SMS1 TaxID=2908894 RepID=UPI001F1DFB8E|nr:hypothetical protein [Pseudoalteromonas sp. SMS1]MCF2859648.1 hypothetical protein [Pseudoalteromonas sp. SMS1]
MKVLPTLSKKPMIHESKQVKRLIGDALREIRGGSGTHKGKDPTEGGPDNASRFNP